MVFISQKFVVRHCDIVKNFGPVLKIVGYGASLLTASSEVGIVGSAKNELRTGSSTEWEVDVPDHRFGRNWLLS